MKRAFLLWMLAGFVVHGGSAYPNVTGQQRFRSSGVPAKLTADEVIARVNSLRAEHGVSEYQVSPILMVIAQSQAEYMAESGVLTHFAADGARPYQRAINAGYAVAGDLSLGGFFSENIDASPDLSASELVEKWKGDSLHLGTMISADLRDVGVGIASAQDTTYYVLDAGAATDLTGATPVTQSAVITATAGTQPAIVITSTSLADGSVYHVVEPNEALWSIALAYDLTVEELKRLNQLSGDDIFAGQKLLIRKVIPSTSTVEPSLTVTLGIPTSTATHPVTPTRTFTPTPLPTPPSSREAGLTIVGGILVLALVAAALGAWLGRRRST